MPRETQPKSCPQCGASGLQRITVANDPSGYVEHKITCTDCKYVWGEFFTNGSFEGLITYRSRIAASAASTPKNDRISICPVCDKYCDKAGCRCEEVIMVGETIWKLTIMVHQECIRKQKGRDMMEKSEKLKPYLEIAKARFTEAVQSASEQAD